MKVSILQMNISWMNPEGNTLAARNLISHSPTSDLYVLPEMWSTGFVTDPRDLQAINADSIEWMRTVAQERNAAVCGSLAVRDEGRYYNRHFFVKPDGSSLFYDKHHLFTYGGEDKAYQPGMQRTVVEWQGWRFLLLTCYDLRFPMWCRYRDDYDAAIVIANWPEARAYAWQILTRARAIENQCFLIGCNRVGDDRNNHYIGQSVILNPDGSILAEGTDGQEGIITADLSLEELRQERTRFTALQERDNI